jgi:RNA polymerase sigma factor (TIGR02999 family)
MCVACLAATGSVIRAPSSNSRLAPVEHGAGETTGARARPCSSGTLAAVNAPSAAPETPDAARVAQLYQQLRSIARRQRRQHGEALTLDTTALVHEAWLQLEDRSEGSIAPRDFFAYAAQAMRNLLIDHARRRLRPKHGGDLDRTQLDEDDALPTPTLAPEQLLDLDAALAALELEQPRSARVVMLHYFAGLDFDRIAEALGLSTRTVMRDWRFARAWLHQRLLPPP